MVSWGTCGIPGMTAPHTAELAFMMTLSAHAAEGCHTAEQKQVGCCAVIPLLACKAWI